MMGCACLIHHLADLTGQILFNKVGTGDIDAHRHAFESLVEPPFLIPCDMSDHVMINLRYESILLKDRNKPARRNKPQLRRIPADERLRPTKLSGFRIVFGLIVNLELFLFHRFLLTLLHRIQPLLLLEHFVVKVCYSGVITLLQRGRCRTCVIILLLQKKVFPAHGPSVFVQLNRQ